MTKHYKIYILVDRNENEVDQKILEPYWPTNDQRFDSQEEAENTIIDHDGNDILTILPIYET